MLNDDFWPDDIQKFMDEQAKAKEERIRKQLSASGNTGSSQSAENQLKSKKLSLRDRLELIKRHVIENLGMHKKDIQVIRTESDLESFITRAVNNGIIAYDTETNNSLDYLTCKIVGLCLYTPGLKAAYVPLGHEEIDTDQLLPNQISNEFAAKQLQRLVDARVKFIMHNGKFDYQVTKCCLGITLSIYWDTMVGCRMINENEEEATLKWQYRDKCDPTHPLYDIDEMFPGVPYAKVEPEVFVYYAAVDALMTYELYLWQKERLDAADEKNVLKLFMEIEMPLVIPVAEMELRGVLFDQEYCARLEAKYSKLVGDIDAQIDEELTRLKPVIDEWRESKEANVYKTKLNKKGEEVRGKSKAEQLDDPIKITSPVQLAILIYDILKAKPVNKEKPRSVDKKTLPLIAEREDIPLCNLFKERSTLEKVHKDFIQKLPTLVRCDGAIHCNFNQCGKEENGVVTGRFSSSEPNMQNIPSHNTEVRRLFVARPGYMMVGADFKAQEPRLTAYYSQDENMLNAYKTNKDLYAVIASAAFDNNYEDNLEFYPEGTIIDLNGQKVICGHKTHKNEEGYARRTQAKALLLGIIYGRGAASIGKQIGKSKKEAQEIIDNFFKSFPKVKVWIDATHLKAKTLGYVEDWFGRKRHLPQLSLPKFTAKYKNGLENGQRQFNPILSCKGRLVESGRLQQKINDCLNADWDGVNEIIKNAAKYEGIIITDNREIIAKAERQSVNSIVQGGAATLTKLAMRNLYYDEELQKLDFHMLITVHDEILGECPKENVDAVVKRMDHIMSTAGDGYLNGPMGIDAEIGDKWYINNYISSIIAEYKELLEGSAKHNIKPMPADEAFKEICRRHAESLDTELHEMLYNK